MQGASNGDDVRPVPEAGSPQEVLLAWVRIVLELYLRDREVAEWGRPQLQQAARAQQLPADAAVLLSVCLDEVRWLLPVRNATICAV